MATDLEKRINELKITCTTYYRGLWNEDGFEHFLWDTVVQNSNGEGISTTIKMGVEHVTLSKAVQRTMSLKELQHKHRHPQAKPTPPSAADVIYSLIVDSSSADETFEDWCSNFGYDTDSRKALDIYLQCQKIRQEFINVFGLDTLDELSQLEY